MTYDARAAADWFIDRAQQDGKSLTPMKLQKLVYVAHGWNLGLAHEPLVHDAVEAWQWGPVFRSIYREFREFGGDDIDKKAVVLDGSTLESREISIRDHQNDIASTEKLLQKIWKEYGGYSAGQLSSMTHRSGTPWWRVQDEHGGRIPPFTVIPNNYIQEHYEQLANGR